MSKWKIKPARSSKDLIKQPECVKLGILPPLNGRILMIGASGSGKSVLLQNIVTEERFYNNKKTFNHTFLISPTAGNDDIQQALNVDEKCIVEDLEDAPACLEHIINDQKKKIKKAGGSHKAPKLLVIFDDVIGSKDFLNTKSFIDCFIRGRHANLTIMLCSQHLMRVPRVCRLQATCLFIFACLLVTVVQACPSICVMFAHVCLSVRESKLFVFPSSSNTVLGSICIGFMLAGPPSNGIFINDALIF